ncbi:hypothetical protein [Paenibacillus sp. KS-LC4]|uniref:hypothetical protein n=1 Tax=Paenibacillus sp. KS-LC4 TaxID=2979727 RepID=UPI0030CCB0DD
MRTDKNANQGDFMPNNYTRRVYIRIACAGIALLPLLFLISKLIQYSVDLPSPDGWMMLKYIEKYHLGTLTFKDFFEQHNEHRLMIPKLILLAIDIPTHWNVYYEIAANVIIGTLIYLYMVFRSIKTYIENGLKYNYWLMVVLSFFCFSIMQFENYSTGFQIQVFLNVLFTVVGLNFLVQKKLGYVHLAASAVFGFLALYSFANGLYYWLVGFIPVVYRVATKEIQLKFLYSWIGASLFFILTYFYHFSNQAAIISNFLHEPLKVMIYFLRNMGASIIFVEAAPIYSVITGAIGVTLFIFISYYAAQNKVIQVLPWVTISSYGLISELSTGAGRLEYFASRYTTISNLFWIGLAVIIFYLLDEHYKDKKMKINHKIIIAVSLSTFFSMFMINSDTFVQLFMKDQEKYAWIRYELLAVANKEIEKTTYNSPYLQINLVPTMQKYKVSVFRDNYEEMAFSRYSNRIPSSSEKTAPFQPSIVNGSLTFLFHPAASIEFSTKPTDRSAAVQVALKPDAIGPDKSDGVRLFWEGLAGSEWKVIGEFELNPKNLNENSFKSFQADIVEDFEKIRLRVDSGENNNSAYDWAVIKQIHID